MPDVRPMVSAQGLCLVTHPDALGLQGDGGSARAFAPVCGERKKGCDGGLKRWNSVPGDLNSSIRR